MPIESRFQSFLMTNFWRSWVGVSLVLLTGCRFGNYVETAPSNIVMSFYETQVQSVTYCAVPSATAQTQCLEAPLKMVPLDISEVMTDPVALRIDRVKKEAYLIGTDAGSSYLPTELSSDTTLAFTGQSSPVQLWDDPACTTQVELTESAGKLVSSTQSSATTSTGIKVPISGRMELTFDFIRVFQGNCSASLQKMRNCYENSNQCGGATARENLQLQSAVLSYFEDFIEAGVLSSAQIATVTGVAYSVSYR